MNTLQTEICRIGRLLWDKDLIGANEGNISVRAEDGTIWATPAGKCKGFLEPGELAHLSLDRTSINANQPSSEIRMHLALYTDRPDVRAVVHAHPCFATALHLACDEFPSQLTPEAAFVLGSVAMVPFSQPGTDEVGIALKPFMPTSNIFLLANHGATTVGSSLDEAFYRMHVLERTAKMWCLSKMLGSVRLLPQEVLNKLTR